MFLEETFAKKFGERSAHFSAASGGLLCPECASRDAEAIECTARAIKVLRVAAMGDAALWGRLVLDAPTLSVLEHVTEAELAHHLDRRLRSFDVLRAIEGGSRRVAAAQLD